MRYLILPVLLFMVPGRIVGQEHFASLVDRAFGLDQELVNGVQFYNRYLSYQGHPYFLDDELRPGSVTIRGRTFGNLQLRFDIYSHCLELSYVNLAGGNNRLILVPDHLDGFTLGEYRFTRMEGEPGMRGPFCQEVRTGNFTCYIGWEKEVAALNNNTSYSGQFSEPERTFLLDKDGSLERFTGRRDFVRLFPESSRKEMIRLLRRRGASFRHDPPREVTGHILAVSDWIRKTGTQ